MEKRSANALHQAGPPFLNLMSESALETLHSFIDGQFLPSNGTLLSWNSPQEGGQTVPLIEASNALCDQAIANACAAFRSHAAAPIVDRAAWLTQAAALLEQRVDAIAALLVNDIGKPVRVARTEVVRGVQFLRACAAQLQTLTGETLPLDAVAAGVGRHGLVRRVPYGVVVAVTPFNAPVNLLVQKVAPALAAGNAVIAKPHLGGTRAALAVAALFVEAGLPAGLFNVICGDRAPARALVRDPRVRVVTFTGGTAAGDALAREAGAKKFVAELGSNAANVVLADADLADAARRIAAAAFEASGQQCVSAQRVIVEAAAYDRFLPLFVEAAQALRVGSAADESTDIGPMVSRAAADRVMDMARQSVASGARYALEPRQTGCQVSPGILIDAPANSPIWADEAFGPLAVIQRAADAQEALDLANDSPFGLQGAVFTRSLGNTFLFAEGFEVGSLWINEASRFRLDIYPFGGAKQSGFGREGVRYAIEELSQLRFIGIRPL